MKIKNVTKNAIKLLKLKLIKTKIYKKKSTFMHFKIENVLHTLKKSFQIIYKYHINKKKILFLNVHFINKIKSVLQNTKHTFLTQSEWFNGKVTNKKIENKYSLVVILDSSLDKSIIKEIYKAKIPVIILRNQINVFNSWHSYRVSGNFSFNKKKTRHYFFLNLLKVIFKKAKQKSLKTKFDYNFPKLSFILNKSLKKRNQ